tara:strand:+ start:2509 stop:3015 length:507 start_codon:yes stop_codon:yes gene_type:complete
MSDNNKDQTEASMEEILASIRRIISQDDNDESSDRLHHEDKNKSTVNDEDEILVLTDVVDEDVSIEVNKTQGKSDINLNAETISTNVRDKYEEPIISSKVEELSISLISDLVSAIGSGATIGTENKTFEQLTKEMLRPMLKEWLDANLPKTVENIVREEIKRIVVKST